MHKNFFDKVLGLLISFLFFSGNVFADPPCACDPQCSYETFYVGASVAAAQLRNTLTIIAPKDSPAPFINDQIDFSQNQITGGVTAGLGAGKGIWFFAVEANSFPVPFRSSATWTGQSGFLHNSEVTMVNIGNLDFIPAIHLSPSVMAYLRGGVAMSWIKIEETGAFGNGVSTTTVQPGLHLGIGFDWRFTDHLSTGLDYTYTNYFKTDLNTQIRNGGLLIPTTFEINPIVNQLGLHLYYNFT